MLLNPIGEIVALEWQKTEQIRSNIKLDAWVIMPNHMHGVLIIDKRLDRENQVHEVNETFHRNLIIDKCLDRENQVHETFHRNLIIDKCLETENQVHETFHRNVSTNTTRLQSNSLGSIIGQFKSVCTKKICTAGYIDFRWQSRFHDHIIRDEESLNQIRQYIINNPLKWDDDEHHPANIHVKK
ncbi:hypothetical protein I8748_19830 [Nostoc sp. CENA67]|uniref:Transposase IS200-like domain-containing protein n=1 Tax=Amazonocrinis nigriterrae CENA67 TaxID=2794033 RepID=A0A8J7HXU0_9NOST|nr:hypothetical protein [Amazonocrinis nigriterrae CENA67]